LFQKSEKSKDKRITKDNFKQSKCDATCQWNEGKIQIDDTGKGYF